MQIPRKQAAATHSKLYKASKAVLAKAWGRGRGLGGGTSFSINCFAFHPHYCKDHFDWWQGRMNISSKKLVSNNDNKNTRVFRVQFQLILFPWGKEVIYRKYIDNLTGSETWHNLPAFPHSHPPACVMGRLLRQKDIPHSILHRMDDKINFFLKKVKTLNGTSSLGRCLSACHVILTYINTQSFLLIIIQT